MAAQLCISACPLRLLHCIRTYKGLTEDGLTAVLADSANVVNCVADPFIYVLIFKETRLEKLKMIKVLCPCLKSTIQKVQISIFDIHVPSYELKTSLSKLK